jgi:hypothetical protein
VLSCYDTVKIDERETKKRAKSYCLLDNSARRCTFCLWNESECTENIPGKGFLKLKAFPLIEFRLYHDSEFLVTAVNEVLPGLGISPTLPTGIVSWDSQIRAHHSNEDRR